MKKNLAKTLKMKLCSHLNKHSSEQRLSDKTPKSQLYIQTQQVVAPQPTAVFQNFIRDNQHKELINNNRILGHLLNWSDYQGYMNKKRANIEIQQIKSFYENKISNLRQKYCKQDKKTTYQKKFYCSSLNTSYHAPKPNQRFSTQSTIPQSKISIVTSVPKKPRISKSQLSSKCSSIKKIITNSNQGKKEKPNTCKMKRDGKRRRKNPNYSFCQKQLIEDNQNLLSVIQLKDDTIKILKQQLKEATSLKPNTFEKSDYTKRLCSSKQTLTPDEKTDERFDDFSLLIKNFPQRVNKFGSTTTNISSIHKNSNDVAIQQLQQHTQDNRTLKEKKELIELLGTQRDRVQSQTKELKYDLLTKVVLLGMEVERLNQKLNEKKEYSEQLRLHYFSEQNNWAEKLEDLQKQQQYEKQVLNKKLESFENKIKSNKANIQIQQKLEKLVLKLKKQKREYQKNQCVTKLMDDEYSKILYELKKIKKEMNSHIGRYKDQLKFEKDTPIQKGFQELNHIRQTIFGMEHRLKEMSKIFKIQTKEIKRLFFENQKLKEVAGIPQKVRLCIQNKLSIVKPMRQSVRSLMRESQRRDSVRSSTIRIRKPSLETDFRKYYGDQKTDDLEKLQRTTNCHKKKNEKRKFKHNSPKENLNINVPKEFRDNMRNSKVNQTQDQKVKKGKRFTLATIFPPENNKNKTMKRNTLSIMLGNEKTKHQSPQTSIIRQIENRIKNNKKLKMKKEKTRYHRGTKKRKSKIRQVKSKVRMERRTLRNLTQYRNLY